MTMGEGFEAGFATGDEADLAAEGATGCEFCARRGRGLGSSSREVRTTVFSDLAARKRLEAEGRVVSKRCWLEEA